MEDNLTHENFSQNLNTTFCISHEDQHLIEVELVEVSPFRVTPRQEIFSILFRGPHEPQLLQYLFTLEHERMGRMELFLVPVSKDEQGMYYEAVFNRLKTT